MPKLDQQTKEKMYKEYMTTDRSIAKIAGSHGISRSYAFKIIRELAVEKGELEEYGKVKEKKFRDSRVQLR
jgi:transposase-like protein|tara:strand:+ start:2535 stop:2747 length:213 start_codon:yes stop_codon:yes gene_type:complete